VNIALRYAARSDVGLVRSNNQDSGYAGPNLLVVADGMGGHAGGDVASAIAIAASPPEVDGDPPSSFGFTAMSEYIVQAPTQTAPSNIAESTTPLRVQFCVNLVIVHPNRFIQLIQLEDAPATCACLS